MTDERPADVPVLIASTIDCNDLEGMTAFWGNLLGVDTAIHDHFGFLSHSPDRKVTLWLQKVDEPRVGKNRVHLDFVVGDLDAACARVDRLGGESGQTQEWGGFVWRTCSDPEGNVFDIMQAPQAEEAST
jgi:predicted enzyme related to lactoylglutathione lyase